jgi:DNA-binding transcriptional MerR regulator
MRIGELARRTEVPARLLRYYEDRGLISPERGPSGYRDYPESAINRVNQIRGLLESGLPAEIIRDVLPCLESPCTLQLRDAPPDLAARLEVHRDRIDRRIACLSRNRDAIAAYLASLRAGDPGTAAASAAAGMVDVQSAAAG